jgi:hypothetical protein
MLRQHRDSEYVALMPMQVVFQHLPNKTTSIYNVELPLKTSIQQLKKDIALRVKIDPEYQKWTYRGRLLGDQETMLNLKLKRDDSIFIEQIDPFKYQQATPDTDTIVRATGK